MAVVTRAKASVEPAGLCLRDVLLPPAKGAPVEVPTIQTPRGAGEDLRRSALMTVPGTKVDRRGVPTWGRA